MNQELFEKHLCNQGSSHYKNMDDFRYAKEAITCNHHFSLSAKMNGTQRRTPEERIGHTAVCQKAPLGLKQH